MNQAVAGIARLARYLLRADSAAYWLRISLVALWLLPAIAAAAPRLSVVALFNGKAMVEIDGRRHLLAVGQTTPEGVRLISASTKAAVLEVDGQRQTLGLSSSVGGRYAAPSRREVHVSRDPRGVFTTAGSVNGVPVSFLVDTGATAVVLNANDATRAGIDYQRQGVRVGVRTASGSTSGYEVALGRVSVGDISLSGVRAVVLEGDSPAMPLLGMSFLGRLKMRHEGALLVLEQLH